MNVIDLLRQVNNTYPKHLFELNNTIKKLQPFSIPIEVIKVPNTINSQLSSTINFIKKSFEDKQFKESLERLGNYKLSNYNLDDSSDSNVVETEKIEVINSAKSTLFKVCNNPKILETIDPKHFEEIVAELLFKQGYQVKITQQTRDGGRDIIGMTKIGNTKFKILAECKRWKRNVGVDIIRSFCDVITDEQVNKGFIFTTSYYTSPAKNRAKRKGCLLDLIDKEGLINWMKNYHEKQI